MTRGRARIAALLAWLTCQLAHLPLAAAEERSEIPVRAMNVTFREVPVLSFSERDFVDPEVVKKLQSGLPQTLITRMYVYHERDRDPLALAALSCRVVYDLWEGVYRIERQTESSDRTLSVRSLDGVIAQCLSVQSQPIGTPQVMASARGGHVYFAVVTELNPLSQDAVQRIRRWLARPTGSELNGNAFFGAFVSIFVSRKLGAADKVLSFRSVPFGVPP